MLPLTEFPVIRSRHVCLFFDVFIWGKVLRLRMTSVSMETTQTMNNVACWATCDAVRCFLPFTLEKLILVNVPEEVERFQDE